MKTLVLGSSVATLCLAAFAAAQDVAQFDVVASGIRYRASAVNTTIMLRPEGTLDPTQSARVLPDDENLSRCDELVALVLERSSARSA